MDSISNEFAQGSKKLKLTVEKPNMDPFEKLFDVDNLIYQHLSGKDVLKLSEVSPAWYVGIGSSSVCMNKIIFNFFLKKGSPITNPTELIRSKRHYANVVIKWENAGMTFPNRTKVIEKFASSVTYLEIQAMSNLKWKPVCFPKLKTLRFEIWIDSTFERLSPSFMEVIGQCTLENLILNGILSAENIFDLVLKQLKSLKMLSLDDCNIDLVFGNDKVSTLHQLKLKKLKITNYQDPQNNYSSSISLFLKSQADTLDHLVYLLVTEDIFKTALELPKLQIFETASYWPLIAKKWSALPKSSSIVNVNILDFGLWAPNDLQALLVRMPNLKQMTLDWINTFFINHYFHIISQNATKLETLFIKCDFDFLKEQYEAIKQNSNIIANHTMQMKCAPFTRF